MNPMFSPYGQMKSIAANHLRKQVRKECDYVNSDGLLVCGVCGQLRQKYVKVPDPVPEDHERMSELLVIAFCRCDEEAEKAEEDKKKAEAEQENLKKLRSLSLIDEKFKNATFQYFRKTQYNQRNFRLCERYATAFDKMFAENRGLLMWGGVGTGKTFAASCIANHLLDRGVSVVMTSMIKVIEAIQTGGEKESSIIKRLNNASLVIFDDLGAERGTDYAIEKVYTVIDDRYRKELPMIFTTNITIKEMLEETDTRYARIYDRIIEICHPMQFTGPSWRKAAAAKHFEEMGILFDES